MHTLFQPRLAVFMGGNLNEPAHGLIGEVDTQSKITKKTFNIQHLQVLCRRSVIVYQRNVTNNSNHFIWISQYDTPTSALFTTYLHRSLHQEEFLFIWARNNSVSCTQLTRLSKHYCCYTASSSAKSGRRCTIDNGWAVQAEEQENLWFD